LQGGRARANLFGRCNCQSGREFEATCGIRRQLDKRVEHGLQRKVERLITLSTSPVAACCSRASFSSRVSRATCPSAPAATNYDAQLHLTLCVVSTLPFCGLAPSVRAGGHLGICRCRCRLRRGGRDRMVNAVLDQLARAQRGDELAVNVTLPRQREKR
jgi:hypothetical protein